MVKAGELRLFNLIQWKGSGVDTVVGIEHDYPDCSIVISDKLGGVAHVTDKEIDGIPLTQEWLKSGGFHLGVLNVFSKDDSGISVNLELTKGLFQPVTIGPDGWIEFCKPLQYLHQLQNLYFALTGEELNIPLI